MTGLRTAERPQGERRREGRCADRCCSCSSCMPSRASSRSSPWWVAATWFQTPAGVGHLEPTVGDILRLWDSKWYAEIAQGGYPLPLPVDPDTSRLTYSAWAFYPGVPAGGARR